MNVSEEEFQYMKKHLITELVSVIVEQEHLTTEEALKKSIRRNFSKKSTIPIPGYSFKAPDTYILVLNNKKSPLRWGMAIFKVIILYFTL